MNHNLVLDSHNYLYDLFKSNQYGFYDNEIKDINFSFMNERVYSNIDDYHYNGLEEGDINLLNNKKDDELNYQFQTPCIKNEFLENNATFCRNQKTEMTSKKTKRINNLNVESKLNMGRKPKNVSKKGDHTKNTEDNMMRKIKTYFIKYIHNLINKSINNKDLQLLKLDSEINEKLKRDYNIKLMATTFRDLYENRPLSSKYKKKTIDNNDINKDIIQKIYSEDRDKEFEVINILNMTYKELFNDFIKNNLNTFLNEIYEKEKANNEPEEDIVNYIQKIKNLCYNYEQWFIIKKGRREGIKKKDL